MTLSELIAIAGLVKTLLDIVNDLKSQGHNPSDPIPKEIEDRVRELLKQAQSSAQSAGVSPTAFLAK